MRKFELLKDLPDAKVGVILAQEKVGGLYMYKSIYDDEVDSWYSPEAVENNPSWFKEIVEKEPFVWTDELVDEYTWQAVNLPTTAMNIESFKAHKQGIPKSSKDMLYEGNQWTNEDLKKMVDEVGKQPTTVKSDGVYDVSREKKGRVEVNVYGVSWVGDEPEKLLVETDPRTTIPVEKHPAIKQAIEQVLNDEIFDSRRINGRLDQLKEIEEAERKAFESYKNSLNQTSKTKENEGHKDKDK